LFSSQPAVVLSHRSTKEELDALFQDPSRLEQAVHSGVPDGLRKKFWCRLILRTENPSTKEYDDLMAEYFEDGRFPEDFPIETLPDFGSHVRLSQMSLPSGKMRSVASVLAMLALADPTVTFCPFVVDLVPFLLRYMNPGEVFAVTRAMISRSSRDQFWFTTNGSSYMRFVNTFSVLLRQRQSKISQLLHNLHIDVDRLFEVWYSRLFFSFLPEPMCLRVLDCFFLEGSAFLLELALGVFACYSEILLRATHSSRQFLGNLHKLMSLEDPFGMMNAAFKAGLRRSNVLKLTHSHAAPQRIPSARITLFNIPKYRSKLVVSQLFCYL